MVTGRGLAEWVLIVCSVALLVANTINIAADLSGMADAAEMLSGLNSHDLLAGFGIVIARATIRLRYYQIARKPTPRLVLRARPLAPLSKRKPPVARRLSFSSGRPEGQNAEVSFNAD